MKRQITTALRRLLARLDPDASVPAAASAGDGARLLALNPALGVNCALLVDRLAGLRSAGQLGPEPADASGPGERPTFAGACWRDADGRVWQEIELAALVGHEQFLGVAT